jgi:hypothetical protein
MRNPRVVLSMLGLAGTIHAVVVDDYHSFCGCIILKSLNNTENASVVGRYMETITITSNDRLQCNNWNAFPEDAITLFPDSDGRPTNDLLKAVGIFYQDAYRFCGSPSVKQV